MSELRWSYRPMPEPIAALGRTTVAQILPQYLLLIELLRGAGADRHDTVSALTHVLAQLAALAITRAEEFYPLQPREAVALAVCTDIDARALAILDTLRPRAPGTVQ